jgi:hypothetical protein
MSVRDDCEQRIESVLADVKVALRDSDNFPLETRGIQLTSLLSQWGEARRDMRRRLAGDLEAGNLNCETGLDLALCHALQRDLISLSDQAVTLLSETNMGISGVDAPVDLIRGRVALSGLVQATCGLLIHVSSFAPLLPPAQHTSSKSPLHALADEVLKPKLDTSLYLISCADRQGSGSIGHVECAACS